MILKRALLALFLFSLLISCKEKIRSFSGKTMGTTYSVKYVSSIETKKVKKRIEEFLKEYNWRFSTYIPNSELSLINKAPVGKKILVSEEQFNLWTTANNIYFKSQGAYDITVGKLVNRWGFGPVKELGRPSSVEVEELLSTVGMNRILFEAGHITKRSDIYVDLSSIAKGDAVDQISTILKSEFELNDFLVEIGGEVRARGKKPDRTIWKVGIETPSDLVKSVQKVVSLHNTAIATSGSYRNYKKYGDAVFNHIIDPRKGYPVEHKTISVSVLNKSCAVADAWATALMSMGVKKGRELAIKEGLNAFFLVKERKKIREYRIGEWGF